MTDTNDVKTIFEEAFKEARADGKKTFTFNGKKYGTVTADDEQKRIDKMPSGSRPSGPPTTTQGATYPKSKVPALKEEAPNEEAPNEEAPKLKARSLVDQGRGVQLYKDVDKEAVLNAGLGLASLYPGTVAARAAAGAIAKGVSKLANKAEIFMRPKVKNSLYSDIPDGKLSGQYAVRNVISPEEIKSIKESGYMLPKKGGKQKKYFVQTDDMPSSVPFDSPVSSIAHIRVPIDKVPANRAVSRKDVEMYNRESGKFEPLKKGGSVKKMSSGGKVSSASSRADGIAQRGKTKGRMC